MYKAYDLFLQTEVLASKATVEWQYSTYRFKCLSCGEDVYIAAINSEFVSPHFRHFSKNNNSKCENYLGTYHDDNYGFRKYRSYFERIEIYYNAKSRFFCLAISLHKDEFDHFQKNSTCIEISSLFGDRPFYSALVNRVNFSQDVPTFIIIDQIASSLFISNTLDGKKHILNLSHNDGDPMFFKFTRKENEGMARLVRGSFIYTNTLYFIAFIDKPTEPQFFTTNSDVKIHNRYIFNAGNKCNIGLEVEFLKSNAEIEFNLRQWNFQIGSPDTFLVIWPPSELIDGHSRTRNDKVFVYSSFNIIPYCNTNLRDNEISKQSEKLWILESERTIKISSRNIETIIEKNYSNDEIQISRQEIHEIYESRFTADSEGSYYSFNSSGVTKLLYGQSVYLTRYTKIVQYESTYPKLVVNPRVNEPLTGENLLRDIVSHYKRKRKYNHDEFKDIKLSDVARIYLLSSSDKEYINAKVAEFIEGGLL